ncbi:MAG: hypothetical protein NDI61_01770 [Bdellovibrionaceae bacterium]|nr:hypothetical protein [Pseudobdellovibrionaceae bacterium]
MNHNSHPRPDEWWIDLIEGETEPSLSEDLTLLLLNSPAGRERLRGLKELRQAIKDSDEVLLPEDGTYYRDMHSRIMAAIDGPNPRLQRLQTKHTGAETGSLGPVSRLHALIKKN